MNQINRIALPLSQLWLGTDDCLSALVLINSFYHGAMPSVAVNVFWIAIGLFALSRAFLGRKSSGRE